MQPSVPEATTFSTFTSPNTMLADLPPSSWETRLIDGAAAAATTPPTAVEPVMDTMSTSGCVANASPSAAPAPFTMLNTPAGMPGLVDRLGEQQRRERRELARLEHHGAAGRQRRPDLGRHLVHRPVPRRQQGADADGLAHDARRAPVLLQRVVAERLHGLLEVTRAGQHLAALGEAARDADLGRHRGRDRGDAALVRLAQPRQQLDALLARRLRVAREGPVGRLHRRLHVGGGGGRYPGRLLLRRRIHDDDLVAGVGRLDPLPVDVEPGSVSHTTSSRSSPPGPVRRPAGDSTSWSAAYYPPAALGSPSSR